MSTEAKTQLNIVRKDEKAIAEAAAAATAPAAEGAKEAKDTKPVRPPRELTPEEKAAKAKVEELTLKIRANVDRLHSIRRQVQDKDRLRGFNANQVVQMRQRIQEQEKTIAAEKAKVLELQAQIDKIMKHGQELRKDAFKLKTTLRDAVEPYCTAADRRKRPAPQAQAPKEGEAAQPAQEERSDIVSNNLEENLALIDLKIRELESTMGTTSTIKEERAVIQKIQALRSAKAIAREFDKQLVEATRPVSLEELRHKLHASQREVSHAASFRVTCFSRIEQAFAAIENSRKDLPQLLTERNALISEIGTLVQQIHKVRETSEETRYKAHKAEMDKREAEAQAKSSERKGLIQDAKSRREEREREALERMPQDGEIELADRLAEELRAEAPQGLVLPAAPGTPATVAADKPKAAFKIPVAPKKEAAIEEEEVSAGFVMIADKGARNNSAVEQFEKQQQQQRAKAKAANPKKAGAAAVEAPVAVPVATEPVAPKASKEEKPKKAIDPAQAALQAEQKKKKQQKLKEAAALGKQVMLNMPLRLSSMLLRDCENLGVKPPMTYSDIPAALTAIYKKKEVLLAKRAEAVAAKAAEIAERKKKEEEAATAPAAAEPAAPAAEPAAAAPEAAAEPAKTD